MYHLCTQEKLPTSHSYIYKSPSYTKKTDLYPRFLSYVNEVSCLLDNLRSIGSILGFFTLILSNNKLVILHTKATKNPKDFS